MNVGRVHLNSTGFFLVGLLLFLIISLLSGSWRGQKIVEIRKISPEKSKNVTKPPRPHQENLLIVEADPGYPNLAIGVKTTSKSYELTLQRLTTQAVTFLQWAKNVIVFGEDDTRQIGSYAITKIKNVKDKHLVALAYTRRRYPEADWYLLIDDTTYVFLPNLYHHIQVNNLSPSKPHYIGYGMHFRGCAGVKDFGTGPMFALGSSGILVSRAAMDLLLDKENGCNAQMLKQFSDCDVSDVRLAMCFHTLEVPIGNVHQRFGFHPSPPTSQNFAWPAPCDIPVAMANAKDLGVMHALYEAERLVREETYDEVRLSRLESALKKFQHDQLLSDFKDDLSTLTPDGLGLPANKNQRQKEKQANRQVKKVKWDEHDLMPKSEPIATISSPVPYGDLYELLLPFLKNHDAYIPSFDRIGSSFKNTTAEEWEECKDECAKVEACMSWSFNLKNGVCQLKSTIPVAKKSKLGKFISTGTFTEHYRCNTLPREMEDELY